MVENSDPILISDDTEFRDKVVDDKIRQAIRFNFSTTSQGTTRFRQNLNATINKLDKFIVPNNAKSINMLTSTSSISNSNVDIDISETESIANPKKFSKQKTIANSSTITKLGHKTGLYVHRNKHKDDTLPRPTLEFPKISKNASITEHIHFEKDRIRRERVGSSQILQPQQPTTNYIQAPAFRVPEKRNFIRVHDLGRYKFGNQISSVNQCSTSIRCLNFQPNFRCPVNRFNLLPSPFSLKTAKKLRQRRAKRLIERSIYTNFTKAHAINKGRRKLKPGCKRKLLMTANSSFLDKASHDSVLNPTKTVLRKILREYSSSSKQLAMNNLDQYSSPLTGANTIIPNNSSSDSWWKGYLDLAVPLFWHTTLSSSKLRNGQNFITVPDNGKR